MSAIGGEQVIRVQKEKILPARSIQQAVACLCHPLAGAAEYSYIPPLRAHSGMTLQQTWRGIDAAIIEKEEFPVGEALRIERCESGRQPCGRVATRCENGYFRPADIHL